MSEHLSLKAGIHRACLELADEKIAQLQQGIDELRAAAQDNSKSSAGDKHETGRAMADLEVEKQQVSLGHILHMRQTLAQNDPAQPKNQVGPGALVKTSSGLFYIVAAIGKIKWADTEAMAVSPDAPLILALSKARAGETIYFNGRSFSIEWIC